MNAPQAIERLRARPRLALAHLPTPLLPAPRLAESVGRSGLDLRIKMDAETGFALGGNKVRKLEFELAPPRLEGVDRLITAGGPQSNHCRVTAALAARLGLRCTLVVQGPVPDPPRGNAFLHRLFGADIDVVDRREDRTPRMDELAQVYRRQGERPLVVPIGASTPRGALGYAMAALELLAQLDGEASPAGRTHLFVPSSSCGTLAGLRLGFALAGRHDVRLVAVSADATADQLRQLSGEIARDAGVELGFRGSIPDETLACDDTQVGAGYGVPTTASRDAIQRFARTEGVVLDPTYTGKAAAGLVAYLQEGAIPDGDRVIFLHTGGHPALLA